MLAAAIFPGSGRGRVGTENRVPLVGSGRVGVWEIQGAELEGTWARALGEGFNGGKGPEGGAIPPAGTTSASSTQTQSPLLVVRGSATREGWESQEWVPALLPRGSWCRGGFGN